MFCIEIQPAGRLWNGRHHIDIFIIIPFLLNIAIRDHI